MNRYTDKPYAALAAAVQHLRQKRGLSVRQYAKQLGISASTLYRVERGLGCDLRQLVLMRERTGLKYETLLGETIESSVEWVTFMTDDEIAELRAWHERRMAELQYPQAVVIKLRRARESWIATIKRVKGSEEFNCGIG